MTIREETINDHNLAKLDAYQESCAPCQLLQSSKWLKFQEAVGHTPHLFYIEDTNIYFSAFEYTLPFGKKYYYIPRGPFLADTNVWKEFLKEFKKTLIGKNIMFVRFEPDASYQEKITKHIADLQPSRTFYTDLEQEEKDLLSNMHPKTRYNIRLSLKKGLGFLYKDSDVDGFIRLMKETSARDNFTSHSSEYYRKMIESGAAQLATIKDNKQILAAGIFATFGNTMTYLHGASSSNKREVMAPFALHWEMMMYAKSEGLKHYDWHGVDSLKWPGFTRFKRGFGGYDVVYPGAFDLILETAAYTGYTVVRSLRRLF